MNKVSIALHATVVGVLALCGATLCGCSRKRPVDHKAQMRREVLRASNLDARRRAEFDAVRVTDANGNLLPSDQRVAGVVLPRGYKPKFTFDHEWDFDGEHSYNKLIKYFTAQLDAKTVTRPSSDALTFVLARTKGDGQMKPVTVTVSPVPGREDWSRFRIIAQPPLPEHRQTKAEIEAELSLRRQNMH